MEVGSMRCVQRVHAYVHVRVPGPSTWWNMRKMIAEVSERASTRGTQALLSYKSRTSIKSQYGILDITNRGCKGAGCSLEALNETKPFGALMHILDILGRPRMSLLNRPFRPLYVAD